MSDGQRTYSEVMRDAADNKAVTEPTQPAPEHTAPERYYDVLATVSFVGWVTVRAESPEDALTQARELDASDFDLDTVNGSVEFNFEPSVEPV